MFNMRKMILKGMWITCLFYPLSSMAQNEIDALRYSRQTFGSTARSLSMGGAFGALGADFSSLMSNPAGIGVFRKSEFSVSLGFNQRTTESEYLGEMDSDASFNVDIPNLGLVLAYPRNSEKAEWKQLGFAIGYNRTANFNSETFYEALNLENSILDSFLEELPASGATPTDLFYDYPFSLDLAYQTYLINPSNPDSTFYSSVIPNGGAFQSRRSSTSGGMGEFTLGFGGNYRDFLYFGITIGFPSIQYEEESFFTESDKDNQIYVADTNIVNRDFESLRYDTYLETSGNGFNARFGMIVRPADWIRAGVAIHTPTYYYMSDIYSSSLRSSFANGNSYSYDSPEGNYSYRLRTPFRAVGSLAFIIGQWGLVSFDYEMTGYDKAKLKASDYDFSNENKIIRTIYSSYASIFRGGVELKYEKFAFRAGAALYSSPFEKGFVTSRSDQETISYTGGIGFRDKRFYVDLGYALSKSNNYFSAYNLAYEDAPGAFNAQTDHRVVATAGWRF